MKPLACLLLATLAGSPAFAAAPPAVHWSAQKTEILNYYLSLIRIDTSSPPGNETKAVEYLKPILDKAGITYQVFALDPSRANLVARIKGNGSKRPLILMGHTDVVGTQRDKWPVDPFAGIRQDGYVWGRGSKDDKPHVVASLLTMLLIKRLNIQLDRDIIFIAEAGEEGNSAIGIDFLVNQHWADIEGEYALAEGGGFRARNGKVLYSSIGTTEKVPRTTRLIAHGTAGHGSRPRMDNAVVHLASAVSRFQTWQPPIRLNDTTRAYFERLATVSAPDDAYRYNHITDPGKSASIDQYFAEHEPGSYSMLRTSIVPTVIKAGFRSNVIPSEAEATLDIRALPDEDMNRLVAQMAKVINDPLIEIMPAKTGRPFGAPSPLDSELFHALESVAGKMYPGCVTVPTMNTGATDNAQLRQKGVKAYGFGPVSDESETELHDAHSDQERLLESSLYSMVQFLWDTVMQVAAHGGNQ